MGAALWLVLPGTPLRHVIVTTLENFTAVGVQGKEEFCVKDLIIITLLATVPSWTIFTVDKN